MDWTFWFSINNTLVNVPLGTGYAMSWIEATATVFGLLCIWCASKAKVINFLFGLINVSLFAIIFYQIQLYGLLMLQLFFFVANLYGWWAWTRKTPNDQLELHIRWLSRRSQIVVIGLSALFIGLLTNFIDPIFQFFADQTVTVINLFGGQINYVKLAPDAHPFWDSVITVLSVVAQILMTRKFVDNWVLWVIVNIVSIGLYTAQGVYVLALEYLFVLFIAIGGVKSWSNAVKDST